MIRWHTLRQRCGGGRGSETDNWRVYLVSSAVRSSARGLGFWSSDSRVAELPQNTYQTELRSQSPIELYSAVFKDIGFLQYWHWFSLDWYFLLFLRFLLSYFIYITGSARLCRTFSVVPVYLHSIFCFLQHVSFVNIAYPQLQNYGLHNQSTFDEVCVDHCNMSFKYSWIWSL